MLLDVLRNFSWYNEPANVRFIEEGMLIETKQNTDLWQNNAHNLHKDDGNFFYVQKQGDFNLTIKWHLYAPVSSDQCGIMVRIDNFNWAKIGFLSTNLQDPQIGSVVTKAGDSDWACVELSEIPSAISLRIIRRGTSFAAFYSLDEKTFKQIRLFSFADTPTEVKIGAYACSPQAHNFECVLEEVSLS